MKLLSALTFILSLVASVAVPAAISDNPPAILGRQRFLGHGCAIIGSGPAYCRAYEGSSCEVL